MEELENTMFIALKIGMIFIINYINQFYENSVPTLKLKLNGSETLWEVKSDCKLVTLFSIVL